MSNKGYEKKLKMISKRIIQIRKSKSLSQTKFAKFLNVAQPSLAFVEKCRSFPSAVFLIKLKEKTGVSIDKLLEA